jgi:hypothetical protein
VQLDEPAGGIAVDAEAAMKRDIVEQRVAYERVPEVVSRTRRLDDPRRQRIVETIERVFLIQARERDELVGVEGRTHDGDALQHLTGRRCDTADHVRLESMDPSRLVRGATRELVHRERKSPTERRDLLDQFVRWLGDVAADQSGNRVVVQRTELELEGAVSIDEALARLCERVAHGIRPAGQHDAHAVTARRAGQVVEQPKAGVVCLVDVVDGEQKAVRGGDQPDQLGGGDEQLLVRAAAGPRDLGTGESAIDLLPILLGEPVEQRWVVSTHIGQRFDDRCIRPRTLDRSRRPMPDLKAQVLCPFGDSSEHRRLSGTGSTDDDHCAASADRAIEQCSFRNGELDVPTDQAVVSLRNIVFSEQIVAKRERLASGRNTELAAQRAVHAFELAQCRMPVAVRRMPAHECQMRELVTLVELNHVFPATIEAQQVEMAQPEQLATILCPQLVAVLGQQLAAVQRKRLSCRVEVFFRECAASKILEPDDVDADRAGVLVGTQQHAVTAQNDSVLDSDRSPCEVRGLVQLGRGLGDRLVGPQQIDDLFTMQPPAGRHRENLHECSRVAALPVPVVDGFAVDGDVEASEHRDLDHQTTRPVTRVAHA